MRTEPRSTNNGGSGTAADAVPGAQALLKGLDVLLAIGVAQTPQRLKDLERAVGIPKASLHRLLSALSSKGLVRYDNRTRTYHLGLRVLELSRIALDQNAVMRVAKPELARLARKLSRRVILSVLDDQDIFVLDFEEADSSSARLAQLWPRRRALDTAAGRAMIAALPMLEQPSFLGPEDSKATAPDKLQAELSIAKALGYIVMTREPATNESSVAAVIKGEDDRPVAALSCSFEFDQVSSEDLHEAGRVIAEGARRASGHLDEAYAWPAVVERKVEPNLHDIQILSAGRDFMGESPLWSEASQKLYWVDVLAPAVRSFDPRTNSAQSIELPVLIGGIAFDDQGRLIAAGQGGLYLVDLLKRTTNRLVDPEPHQPDNRFNNINVDPQGRLWGSTMAINHQQGHGSLYCIGPDLNVERKIAGVTGPKAAAFSPDAKIMYFSEGANTQVWSYVYDAESGAISDRSVFIAGGSLPGKPNGLTVDSSGFVWVTCLGGWCVRCYAHDGSLVTEIGLPFPMPTNCTFGGDDLSTLYVTSSFIRLPPGFSAIAPASGQIVAIKTNSRGQRPNLFRTRRNTQK